MKTQDIYHHLKTVLPFIGIVVFIYIIYDIGISKISESISQINGLFVIISCLIFFPRIIMSTYKWKIITQEQGIDIKLAPLIKFNIIGIFYGTITPLWLGDYIRIPYLKDETGETFGKCASSVMIDQVLELAALFILGLGGAMLLWNSFPILFMSFCILFLVFIIIAIFLKEKERSIKLCKIIYRICIPKTLKSFMVHEFHTFYEHMPSLKFLLYPLLIEIGSYVLFFTQIYILALSFTVDIAYMDFILIYPIASLVGLIPITISGFGTREGTLIQLLSHYDIPSNTIVALSLTGYFVTTLMPSFIGGVLSLFHHRKIKEKTKKIE